MPATAPAGEFTYSGLAIENIRTEDRVQQDDKVEFTINSQPAGKAFKTTGDLANIVATDVDIGAMAAIFDPAKANDDREYRVQGHGVRRSICDHRDGLV